MTAVEITFAEQLARLGFTTETPRGAAERISICHEGVGSPFRSSVSVWSTAPATAARLIDSYEWNLWCSVNALREVAKGRGKERDVVRLAALFADLDFKEGGCGDPDTARVVTDAISEALGEDPVANTHSGHGFQPYWAVEAASALLLTYPEEAKRLLDRFKALVMKIAADHGAGVDPVWDLARVLRIAGSTNYKDPENPVPVRCFAGDGKPLTVERITAALDAAGIPEDPEKRGARRKKPPRGEKKPKDDKPPLYAVSAAMTSGKPSPKVRARLGEALTDVAIEISRHDKTRDHVLALLRYGYNGEPGVAEALEALYRHFVLTVGPDRMGGQDEAATEFTNFVAGAEELLAAEPPQERFVWPGPTPTFGTQREEADDDEQAEESSLLDRLARDGAWLDEQQFAPLEYAVPGIIPEGMGLLVGPPKKGKSWLVANIGLAVARGGLALGAIRTTQRPVLYLALEDGDRRLQSRFRRLLGFGQPIPPGIRRITEASPGEAMAVIAEFMHRYADEKPLVILDTLGKVKRHKKPGEDSYLVDYEVGSTLKALADAVPGSTLLVVHHTRKAEAADFVDTVSGTQGIAGSVDFVLVLTRKRHENNAILSVTGRDIVEAEYALHADDGVLWRLDGEDLAAAQEAVHQRRAESNLGDRMMDVYLVVQAADGPVTAVDVANQMDGLDNNAAGTYLRRLFAGGYITRVSRGLYGVSEVSEVSETGPNSSSEGVNDLDTASDGVSEVSESPSDDSSTSDTSDSVSEAVSESNTAADQAEHADSDTSDTSDTHPEDEPTDTALAMTSRCPTCGTAPGRRCATVLARGYHIARMNKAVRRQRKTDRKEQSE